jgi:capsular exopolysaccharide synthesis family protein
MRFSWKDIWELAKRWWWLLAIGTVLAGGVSYRFSSRKPKIYAARATLQVGSTTQATQVDERTLGLTRTLARVYSEHVRRRSVTQAVVENLGLQMSPGELAGRIQTNVIESASLLEIFVLDSSPQWAAILANAVAEELIRQSPGASSGDLAQERQFIMKQMSDVKAKIEEAEAQIQELRDSVLEMTSAAEIADANARISELQQVQRDYQSTYAQFLELLNSQGVNTLTLIEPAVEWYYPVSPNVKKDTVVAAMAGFALAAIAVAVLEFLDDTLRIVGSDAETVEGLPALGALSRLSGQQGRVIVRSKPRSPEAEAVRQMRTKVMMTKPHGRLRSLSVTSPQAKDGKTNIVANLGVAMAAGGMRVVLVDGDMRSPALHESFDQPNLFGLAELAGAEQDECRRLLSKALRDTDVPNLSLITAGRPPLDPSVLLTSPRMPEVMMLLQKQFDCVIIDSPPVPVAPDATIAASLVEGTLLVVCPGRTSRSATRRSRDQLNQHQDSTLLGVVLNRVPLSHYVYHYTHSKTAIEQQPGRLSTLTERLRERLGRHRDGELVSLGQAARALGIRRETAKRWRRVGRLPAVRKGLRWWVHREDLQALLNDLTPSESSPTAADNGHEPFWIPLTEAAEQIGLDEESLRARCEAGQMSVVQRNGRWWVDETALEAVLASQSELSASGVAEA